MFMRLLKFGGQRGLLLPAALAGALLCPNAAAAGTLPARITVYAPASMTDVIGAAAKAYAEKTETQVRQVYAASSVIARQAVAGAPADLVISANEGWMDFLQERGLLEPGTRTVIARNRLVAVVPADSPVTAAQGPELGRAWIPQRLAVGETAAVPAGIYAREALSTLDRWEDLKGSLVMAGSVRVALAWVARGEVDAGIVYASDAAITARVRQVWTVPETAHSPILYPAAALKGKREGLGFLRFLTSDEGKHLFAGHGFRPAGS